jgi:hypothetical protein
MLKSDTAMIPRLLRLLRLSVCLGWLSIPLAANDASVYGDGSPVFPFREERIRMAKEGFVIRNDRVAAAAERWKADGTFTFVNESTQTAKVQMAFPDSRAVEDEDSTYQWGIRNFKGIVDGKPVKATPKYVEMPPQSEKHRLPRGVELRFDRAFTWAVRFRPKATVVVKNTYVFGGVMTNGPFSSVYTEQGFTPAAPLFCVKAKIDPEKRKFDFDDGLADGVTYIVTSGRTWSGPIGEAHIAIEMPPGVLPHLLVPSPCATSMGQGFVRWDKTDWLPEIDLSLYRTFPTSKDLDQLNVNSLYDAPSLFESVEQAKAWLEFAKANGAKPDLVKTMHDAYLARSGHRFQDPLERLFGLNSSFTSLSQTNTA